MGNGAVGAFQETMMVLLVVVANTPLIKLGTAVTAGIAGATIDVVAEAPLPSTVRGVTRNVYTTPGVSPVTTIFISGVPAGTLPPRFADKVVHVVPPFALCSSM